MSRDLTYTVTELPAVWPGRRTPGHARRRAPFKSQWSKTVQMLGRELAHLGAKRVEIACEIRGERDIRQDGQLRSDARPGPAVIVSFIDRGGQRQAYPCDTFGWWQDNLYAIAVVLEDLRRAERYGVHSDLIRAGFKALPSSTAPSLSAESAAEVLSRRSVHHPVGILNDPGLAQLAYRAAASKAHPDRGGTTEDFQLVQEAKRVLEAHHGASL